MIQLSERGDCVCMCVCVCVCVCVCWGGAVTQPPEPLHPPPHIKWIHRQTNQISYMTMHLCVLHVCVCVYAL